MKVERIKERLRNFRRTFRDNWLLFKESRIGIFGLGVIIFFLVIALLAPILDINDPIKFRAPEGDVIDFKEFWNSDLKIAHGDLGGNTSVALRIEKKSFDPKADRIYVAASDKLFALDSDTQISEWISLPNYYQTNGEVSTPIVAVNYGENQLLDPADYWIYVGTSDGYLHAIKDTEAGTSWQFGIDIQLDSAVSSIAVYNSEDSGVRDEDDKVFAGTENGKLYAFAAVDHTELWNITLDGEVHMTPGPLRGMGGYPIYSPALSQDGTMLMAGTGNGTLYAIYTENSTVAWKFELEETTWGSSPIIGVKEFDREVVYFGTDEGWLYALYVNNGTEIMPWRDLPTNRTSNPVRKGVLVVNLQNQPDSGKLTTPEIYWGGVTGTTKIFIGSDTGSFYKITREQAGEPGDDNYRPPGSTEAEYRELAGLGINYRFEVQPSFYPLFGEPKYIFAVENNDNGTADPSDDKGAIHALSLNLTSSWRISEDKGVPYAWIPNRPVSWDSPLNGESIWFVTSEAVAYSYRASGEYNAPLPPTWVEPLPSGNTYWLGLDTLGHDVFAMLVHGTRTALLVGFLAAFFSILIGVIVGLVSGYFGGKTDSVLMRFTDVILVLPFLPLVIVLAAVLGPNVWNIIIVIAILGWGGVARVIRSEVLSLKERPFIDSAKVTGASNVRIMFKHIAPNVLPLAFLYMTFAVSGAILTEAALSFIGLGDFTQPSWGIMLFYVQQTDAIQYWWLLWPPGLCITFLSLGFYLIGRAFEQIVNPRLRRRR
jgi:peptide/nickel transport system permease protein